MKKHWPRVGIGVIVVVLGLFFAGPFLHHRDEFAESSRLQAAHIIGVAMFSYANDNGGNYPTGNSSTEVFQKLIDGGYIADPSTFFNPSLEIAGKSAATTKTLKPENICWDVTVPVTVNSPRGIPVLFPTGYRVEYVPNGRAIPLTRGDNGFGAFYLSNMASFSPATHSDGIVFSVLPADFDAKGVKYVQLTPDRPLP